MALRLIVITLWLFCALSFVRKASARESPTVVVWHSDEELLSVSERISVELASAGYNRVTVEVVKNLPACTPNSHARARNRPEQLPVVDIAVRRAGHDVAADVCARTRPQQISAVTVEGPLEEEAHFAIVVTEALHGLLQAPGREIESDANPDKDQREALLDATNDNRVIASLTLSPRFVFDVPTGQTWAGASLAIQVPLSLKWGFRGQFFSTFRPITYVDEEIDLQSHLLFARWGIFGSKLWDTFRVGWNVEAGPYFNRATAQTVAPRVGGSDAALGAILYTGAFAEFPSRGHVFLRPSLGISTLIPRLRYQMSRAVTSDLGELMVEGGLEFGLRLF